MNVETLATWVGGGYRVRERIALHAEAKGEVYRLEVDGDAQVTIHSGFVDPVAAADRLSFSHMPAPGVVRLRETRARGETLLVTQRDYASPISLKESRVSYGRGIPLLNGVTQEVQVREVGRSTLDAWSRERTHDPQALWALEPPRHVGGDARLYLLTPGPGIDATRAEEASGKIVDHGSSISIGGVCVEKHR